jgi:hypothetical protein
MKDRDERWVTVEEAIQYVMKTHGCSRRAARKLLTKSVKANKVQTRHEIIEASPPGKVLEPSEAVERFKEDPASVFMPLDYFVQRFDFSQSEIMGELQSGRLRARANENSMMQVEITGRVPASQITIDAQAMIDWMTNPKTPPALLAKFMRNYGQRPS